MKAQAAFPVIKTDSRAEIRSARGSYDYRYASLAAVIDGIRGPLNSNGISYTQVLSKLVVTPARKRGKVRPATPESRETFLITKLLHVSGQWICSYFPIPLAIRLDPQAIGSFIAYARRYSITGITGVAIEDDDGKSVQPKPDRAPSQQRAPVAREPGCDDQRVRSNITPPSRETVPNGREPRTVSKPRTGEWLAQTANKQGLFDEFTAIGKRLGYPLSFKDWTTEQVDKAIQWRREKLTS